MKTVARVVPTRVVPRRVVPTRDLPTRDLPTRVVPTRDLPTRERKLGLQGKQKEVHFQWLIATPERILQNKVSMTEKQGSWRCWLF